MNLTCPSSWRDWRTCSCQWCGWLQKTAEPMDINHPTVIPVPGTDEED